MKETPRKYVLMLSAMFPACIEDLSRLAGFQTGFRSTGTTQTGAPWANRSSGGECTPPTGLASPTGSCELTSSGCVTSGQFPSRQQDKPHFSRTTCPVAAEVCFVLLRCDICACCRIRPARSGTRTERTSRSPRTFWRIMVQPGTSKTCTSRCSSALGKGDRNSQ